MQITKLRVVFSNPLYNSTTYDYPPYTYVYLVFHETDTINIQITSLVEVLLSFRIAITYRVANTNSEIYIVTYSSSRSSPFNAEEQIENLWAVARLVSETKQALLKRCYEYEKRNIATLWQVTS